MGGAPQGAGSQCTMTDCPRAQACCLPDGSCTGIVPDACANLGGAPQGAFTLCSLIECTCNGDINGDGRVDSRDLSVVLGSFGTMCPPKTVCPGDLNGDGAVNSSDLSVLIDNFGRICAAVP